VWNRCGGIFDLPAMQERVAALEKETSSPDFWSDQSKAREKFKQLAEFRRLIAAWTEVKKQYDDLLEIGRMAEAEKDASLDSEISAGLDRLGKALPELEIANLFNGEYDHLNAIVNIHPGAGGTESQDWAQMLLRMYSRWAERKGFHVDTIDLQPGEEAGIKNVTLLVSGERVFGHLRSEKGVHRLVRISPFDANKRRHTSFAAVDVFPEIDETINVDIKPDDLKFDTYRSSGAGGQHVNKTESAVRITHKPTGIIVQCQVERSQFKNREMAMKILRARLFDYYRRQLEEKKNEIAGEKKNIAWGNQIRSYVFQPYTMVKDLRTGFETSNVQGVMDGEINEFIEAYLRKRSG